ncbi:MAG: hypothetical protein GY851_13210 [bacterium]|nr:hypothetical protein [bacterium]
MPQPVDMQTEIARTTAVERIQEIAGRLSLAAQQRAVAEAEDERILQEQQVKETRETQSDEVDEEGHRRNPFMGRRRHRDQGNADADKAQGNTAHSGDGEAHQLDVSV